MPEVIRAACACGQSVEAQHQRHLTAEEYAALPEGLRPTDGHATRAVFTCGDCAPDPFCEHPDAEPVPCPTCKAQPGDNCVKGDGSARVHQHPARAAAQPVPETCRHAHREDCDHRACACSGEDEPPVRAARPAVPEGGLPDLSSLGFPLDMVPTAAAWLAANKINPALVRGGFRSGYTQRNERAMLFDYASVGENGAPVVDEHGHEDVQLRIVPIPVP